MQVLKLTNGGLPVSWVNQDEAASLVFKGMVNWSIGDEPIVLHGGFNKSGDQSTLEVPSIIAVAGARPYSRVTPLLTNRMLFKRDGYRCLYCGEQFSPNMLTRDHITPKGQNGPDIWMNVVSACKCCNNTKGCRTPEQAKMPLLAIPFVPNPYEVMFLSARRISEHQHDYLSAKFSRNMSV